MHKFKSFFIIFIFCVIAFSLNIAQVQAISFSDTGFLNFPKITKKPKPLKTPKSSKTPKPTPAPKDAFVKILYPNGGEIFTYGDTVKVRWEMNKVNSCFLGFSFGEGSLNWINTEITGNMTSYDWVIDDWNMGFDPVKMKLELDCWSDGGQPMDQSDDFFTVNPVPTPSPSLSPSAENNNVPGNSSYPVGPIYSSPSPFMGGVWIGTVSTLTIKKQ
jgi:hypothetical protein